MQSYTQHRRSFSQALRALSLCVALASPAMLHAQAQNTGAVAGSVFDSAHNLIVGAAVTLTSEDRGNVYKIASSAQGEYTFNDVPVGTYTLEVTAPGFSTFVSHHVVIDSDTRLRIDSTLATGAVDTQVVVSADQAAVDTQSATVGQVIDNELVENLPIDGNNVVALAALLPGVTDVSAPTTFTDENGGATFSANGARGNSNLFLFDGLLWNNLYLNTGINYPNHAALNQVSVQLNNYSAQYGRSAGSIFNVVSKSGGNTTHGEIFFHYHDATLTDATNYFTHNVTPQQTAQYGGAVNGAIFRDKLFYAAEFQGLTGYSGVTANAETLSAAEEGLNPDGTPYMCTNPALAGKQCASFAADAQPGVSSSKLIINPIGASPIPASFGVNIAVAKSQIQSTWNALGNSSTSPCINTLTTLGAGFLVNAEIPAECFDPTVQAIIHKGYIPAPTVYLGGSQLPYSSPAATRPQREYGGFLRLDYNITPRQTLAARFYRTENSDSTANGGGDANVGVPTYEVDYNRAFITAGSLSHTFILTQNLVNVATIGYKRYDYGVVPSDNTTLATLGSQFQYPGYQSLPTISVSTRFTLGNSSDAFTRSIGENEELVDNLSLAKGRHNFQFGVDYLREQYLNVRTNVGSFSFLGNPGFTDAQASDFIMGLVYQESFGNTQRISARQNAVYAYAQDQWRATARMNVTYGVRYELPQPWYQPDGQAATFVRGYQSIVIPNAPAGLAFVGDPGIPKSLIKPDYSNISPRIGISYDLFGNGKTAIRAGFGTFYDAIPATIVGLTQPYTYRANYTLPAGSLTNPLLGFPSIPQNFTGKGTAQFTQPYSVIAPDSNFRNSYTLAVNLGFQQRITSGSILEMNYIGRFSRHQLIAVDQNPAIVDCSGAYFQANPTLYCGSFVAQGNPASNYAGRVKYLGYNYGGGGIVDLESAATANYNALQITYRQRAFRNLTLLGNYTYSRAIDEQSSLSTSSSVSEPQNIAINYGVSDQNATQIFNMGWRLGLGKFRNANSLVKNVFNDWAFNGIYNARTGHPVNVTFGGDELGTDEPGQRAYLIPGMNPFLPSNRHRTQKIAQWFNSAAFQKPAPFTATNIGRNFIIGPAYINTQFSLTKELRFHKLGESTRAQFRAEAFNVFNTVNLGQPRANYSASLAQSLTFGSINSVGTNGNRRIQFGVIIYF
ncbi:TonB-dependent Receptor Plug Domain [Granulicella rosea]|uniref:TonB-dependent Receptor Plug Domain n=1 Tax=Granulicella rosea TaxID=474952 RepID=A0A239MG58_9BACT|nr:carboxypeptidase regulatory-like domain-containing protein [Granulicella rosea]SNT41094.1 TonB-dependent Receptor Plug Domain [Granulicella rosea]